MKNKMFARVFTSFVALTLCFATVGCNSSEKGNDDNHEPVDTTIKNVILFIGDGMGPEEVKYGQLKKGSPLSFQQFEHQTVVDTNCVTGTGSFALTDSSAAATALATGTLTKQGRVGYGPEDEVEPLKTIMDWAIEEGKSTGVITTEALTGATPMGFSAHALDRNDRTTLIASAAQSGVSFFAGDQSNYGTAYEEAGYTTIDSLSQIPLVKDAEKLFCNLTIKATNSSSNPSYALFDEIIGTALDYLSQNENGFMLMAEGAHIDHGGHANNIAYMVEELLAFDKGVEAAVNWAKNRHDTVILVTADHETGGLQLKNGINSDNMDEMEPSEDHMTYTPKYYEWTSKSHTAVNVGLYVTGLEELRFEDYSYFESPKLKNADIFNICKDLILHGELTYSATA